MGRVFKVALAQMNSEVGNVDSNIEKMLGFIARAADEDAALIVFPEMCLTGYMVLDGKDFDGFFNLAEDKNGPAVAAIAEACQSKQMHAVFGMPMKSEFVPGIVFNSAVMVDPRGMVQAYHKTHLPTGKMGSGVYYEALYAQPGETFPLMDTDLGQIGLEICYDLTFPEVSRIYAVKGAEIIINISAGPSETRINFERLLPARAFENVCYMIYVNVGGVQRDLKFFGASRVLDPVGNETAKCADEKEDFVLAEINTELVEKLRHMLLAIRDRNRRPEIYAELIKQYA